MNAALIRQALAKRDLPIRVGIIGAGAMGKGILYQTLITPGVECVALCDRSEQALEACVSSLGVRAKQVSRTAAMTSAIRSGYTAVCADGALVAGCDEIDVLVEASSAIAASAGFVATALSNRRHVVLMNAEVDLLFGPYFLELARTHGVVVTSCDGDQHGVIKQLIDDMVLWGFEPVMAGNIKGFLDRHADPVSIVPEAEKRRLDPKMCTAYTDGSKLCIEMAIVANALGMRTDVPGMHGPLAASVTQVLSLFDFESIRRSGTPVVDYILGAEPGGGVYAVGYHEHPYQSFMMDYYKLGPGPYYTFYRPYHLCHVESIASIVSPVLDGFSLLEPTHGFRTNVFAYAKRALRAGQRLDGIGGHCCYGLIENIGPGGHVGLPIGLTEDVVLVRDVAPDAPIGMSDIDVPAERADFRCFAKALAASGRLGAVRAA